MTAETKELIVCAEHYSGPVVADEYGVCGVCGATACRPLEPCWWCAERERWALVRARELDIERLTDLLERHKEEAGLMAEIVTVVALASKRGSITPHQAIKALTAAISE